MCGLVSIVTKLQNGFSKDQVDAFNDLLFLDSLRGMDSTGAILIENNGHMQWNKEAIASPLFCRKKEHQDMLTQAFHTGRALVGHNRAATRGVVNDANAHPFTVDDRITLVHNGTLYGDHRKLADVDVDSHAIAHVIHEKGDDVEAALQELSGAFALIWHDYKANTLNFVRNAARPLHWVETDSCWIWASEANMIEWILARYPNFKVAEGQWVEALPPGVLTTYNFSNRSWAVDVKDIELTKKYTAPATGQSGSGGTTDPLSDDEVEAMYCGFNLNAYHHAKEEVPFVPKQTSTNVVALPAPAAARVERPIAPETAKNTPRVIKFEMDLAFMSDINMSGPTFATLDDVVKTGDWVRIQLQDYVTVARDTPASGYFVYGKLMKDPRFMTRTHIPGDITETEIMDMTFNNKEILMKVDGRNWRAFNDAKMGQGYGLITGNKVSEIITLEETVGE